VIEWVVVAVTIRACRDCSYELLGDTDDLVEHDRIVDGTLPIHRMCELIDGTGSTIGRNLRRSGKGYPARFRHRGEIGWSGYLGTVFSSGTGGRAHVLFPDGTAKQFSGIESLSRDVNSVLLVTTA
jgi:hypothetical protein